jgi:hypothetical protein
MAQRLARRVLFFATLALLTMLVAGELKALATTASQDSGLLLRNDQVAAVQRGVEAEPGHAPDASPTAPVVIVFAGIVLLAVLPPPVHGIYLYYRSDWL